MALFYQQAVFFLNISSIVFDLLATFFQLIRVIQKEGREGKKEGIFILNSAVLDVYLFVLICQ